MNAVPSSATASSAIPSSAKGEPAVAADDSVAAVYGEFAASCIERPIGEAARHGARRCIIDWYAATLAGSVLPPGTLLQTALSEEVDRGACRLLPQGRHATARAAALINGSASHTVEFDDIYRWGIYHPGSPVIAAALATAEREDMSGERFLRAVIAGYEVSNRIAAAVVRGHYRYWHTTGTVGCHGAAVAASVVLGLRASEIVHAINAVTSMAAGLQQAFRSDSMSKPQHAGRAAEAGVLVALSARAGVTGALAMLEGPVGFGEAMSADVDWQAATRGLGEDYTVTRITQKNHGCCGHTFAALDGVIALRDAHALKPENVRKIRIGTYQIALDVCTDFSPETGYQAKFSLPYCASVALFDGRVRLSAFDAAHLEDRAIRAFLPRVELYRDDDCDTAAPDRRSAIVTIETVDGRVLEHHSPTRKGDPDAPLSDEELMDKYRELAGPVLGDAAADRLASAIWRIDELESVRAIPLGKR